MTFHLRPYQAQAVADVHAAWDVGHKAVALRLPTGGGKTPTFGSIMAAHQGASVAIAHRSELVGQMSLALARYGIRHRVIGPDTLQRDCVAIQMAELGRSYFDPNARAAVAGIDTLIRRDLGTWASSVGLAVVDEGHHTLRVNKWGKGLEKFPNARTLLVTATVNRADGKGLGRHADGVADTLVEGPELTDLQGMGYLTPCRIYSHVSDLDLAGVATGADGDFNQHQMKAAVHRSRRIVGDIVDHYLERARGKLGITFCADIEHCEEVAEAYRSRGVPAEVVTGEDLPAPRAAKMRRFRARQTLQLVNVDVLGEGVDVPAVEVVSMGRPTNSANLFAQQAGRMLRLMLPPELTRPGVWDGFTDAQRRMHIAQSAKPFGLLLDHVGNVERHAVAHECRLTGELVVDLCHGDWSLDRREARGKAGPSDVIPTRACTGCGQPYPRFQVRCPYCGVLAELAGRSTPEQVDGRLEELTPAALAALLARKEHVDGMPVVPFGAPKAAQYSAIHLHHNRQLAQRGLRESIALWAGKHYQGDDPELIAQWQSRFFHRMKVDVLTAQSLGATEAFELEKKVRADL